MRSDLLRQFLDEECTSAVVKLLRDALAETPGRPQYRRFELNRFNVTLDVDAGYVLIEDVLDASSAGAVKVSLAEFSSALDAPR